MRFRDHGLDYGNELMRYQQHQQQQKHMTHNGRAMQLIMRSGYNRADIKTTTYALYAQQLSADG